MADRRGLVLGPARRHLRRPRRRWPRPRAGSRGRRPVGGEQLAVVEQLDDDLGGQAASRLCVRRQRSRARRRVAAVGEVGLAVMLGHLRRVQRSRWPVSQFSQLALLRAGRWQLAQVQRGPVGPRQHRDRLVPGHPASRRSAPWRPAASAGRVIAVKSSRRRPRGQLRPAARHVGEVPQVVVEHGRASAGASGVPPRRRCRRRRTATPARRGPRRCRAVIGCAPRGAAGARRRRRRRGGAAGPAAAGSKRSSTWPIRWE